MPEVLPTDAPPKAPLQSPAPMQPPRVRARTFLIGLPLVVALCCLSLYADMVSKVVQFGVLQIAPPAVIALLGLALLNRGLVKWANSTCSIPPN